MNVGDHIDLLLYLVSGIVLIFVAIKNKEKLGNKSKLVMWGGVAFILLGIMNLVVRFHK